MIDGRRWTQIVISNFSRGDDYSTYLKHESRFGVYKSLQEDAQAAEKANHSCFFLPKFWMP